MLEMGRGGRRDDKAGGLTSREGDTGGERSEQRGYREIICGGRRVSTLDDSTSRCSSPCPTTRQGTLRHFQGQHGHPSTPRPPADPITSRERERKTGGSLGWRKDVVPIVKTANRNVETFHHWVAGGAGGRGSTRESQKPEDGTHGAEPLGRRRQLLRGPTLYLFIPAPTRGLHQLGVRTRTGKIVGAGEKRARGDERISRKVTG
jgi:hypothetical protein